MIRVFALLLVIEFVSPTLLAQRTTSDTTYKQPFRPQYHFSPRMNWTNDPNGLVYYDSEYHLFYQYNPFGNQWGHMTWGHAISRDLVHWQELSPAIPEEGPTMIFSGSCVVDKNNTSGFGQNGAVPLVAIYTGHQTNRQNQHIAYSIDKGRTWTKYTGNPVVDLNKKDFRDPKVFWHEPTQRWVMVVLLPTEKKALFYNSLNLKKWVKTGEFTATDSPANVWECPDLVEVPVEGTTERKWVLLLSMGSHGAAGGSGMQYYVGRFDGSTFINESKPVAGQPGKVRYVDWGKDYYAAITYNNMPIRGNRGAVSIGWMSNLQYAGDIPTIPFRGMMTLPRELRLSKSGVTTADLADRNTNRPGTMGPNRGDRSTTVTPATDNYELRQRPIQELKQLLGTPFRWNGTDVAQLNESLTAANVSGDTYMLTMEVDATQSEVGVRVRKSDSEETIVGYEPSKQQVYVDRTRSGNVAFKKEFPGRFAAPLKPLNGRVTVQVWVDRSSVEVFANDGQVALTNQIFPSPDSRRIEFFGGGLRSVTIQAVEPIWR